VSAVCQASSIEVASSVDKIRYWIEQPVPAIFEIYAYYDLPSGDASDEG